MPSLFRHLSSHVRHLRIYIVGMLLVAFILTAVGIPLPAGNRVQESNEPFPCETSSCGCNSAKQCWRSCCCHTFAERLAWAREYGVRPPSFAIAQARAAGIDMSWLETGEEVKLACYSRSCCEGAHAPAPRSCREQHDVASKPVHSCCSPAKNTQRDRTVIAWHALQCGGHSMNWLAAVPTLINVRVDFPFEASSSTWLPTTLSDVASGTPDLPTVPPPELA